MKQIIRNIERLFERMTSVVITILGSSIAFIIAFSLVLFGVFDKRYNHEFLRDLFAGITFLSLFLIQKSFNRFSASLHLKVNELVSSHESASNAVIDIDEKTEREITALSKEYTDIVEVIKIKVENPFYSNYGQNTF